MRCDLKPPVLLYFCTLNILIGIFEAKVYT